MKGLQMAKTKHDSIWVSRENIGTCICDVLLMRPERINDHEITCLNCNKPVLEEAQDSYNWYWGFSGYDEGAEDVL